MTEHVSKRASRLDSVLAHCLARAVVHDLGGWDAAQKHFEDDELHVNVWMGVKATPKASRVASFICLWAIGMKLSDRDSFSITEYQRYWNEGERQAYRLQKEFRELWPEFETPDQLAAQIVRHVDKKASKRDAASLPLRLQVTA